MIAIGVSTGGPDALATLLPDIPADLAVPIVIVQHMPPVFTGLLAKRMDAICPLNVVEAKDGDRIDESGIWIAPGGIHLTVVGEGAHVRLRFDDGPPVQSCKPAVDVMFQSVAKCYGEKALAVVLTGMGMDGCDGAQAISKAGGRVVIQDEESSVVWGMPGAVAKTGIADGEFPIGMLASELASSARAGNPALV